jgi:hypothetical protein
MDPADRRALIRGAIATAAVIAVLNLLGLILGWGFRFY